MCQCQREHTHVTVLVHCICAVHWRFLRAVIVSPAGMKRALTPFSSLLFCPPYAVDGLHLRSGIPKGSVSELHGCVFQEQCKSCGTKFQRSFDVTVPQGSSFHRHKTGRRCGGEALPGASKGHTQQSGPQGSLSSVKEECEGSVPGVDAGNAKSENGGEEEEKENPGQGARLAPGCGGILLDTIVHFNECLDADELSTATEMSTGADLALCLGSSFKARPLPLQLWEPQSCASLPFMDRLPSQCQQLCRTRQHLTCCILPLGTLLVLPANKLPSCCFSPSAAAFYRSASMLLLWNGAATYLLYSSCWFAGSASEQATQAGQESGCREPAVDPA